MSRSTQHAPWAAARRFITTSVALAGAAILTASNFPWTATPAAQAASAPSLEKLELVTNQAVGGDGGNSWGSNKLRIARTSTGDLYTSYVQPGADATHKQWVLMHRPPSGGWSQVSAGPLGREPANVLVSPTDRVYLLTWPNGAPTIVNDAGPDGQGPYTANSVQANWPAENWPYAAAATLNGDQYILRLYAPQTTNTQQLYAVRKSGTTNWTTGSFNLPVQYAYAILLPDPKGGVHLIMTRDTTWATLGYAQPTSGSSGDFVQDRVSYWYSPDLSTTPFQPEVVVHTEAQPAGTNDYVHAFAQDAYLDTQGRVHILYSVQSAATGQNYVGHHAILQNGKLIKDVTLPSNVYGADDARIVQDSSGRFYVVSWVNQNLTVYPADSVDGTQVGAGTTLNLAPYTPDTWFWLTAPRGGSQPSNSLDGVFSAASGTQLVYFRVNLTDAAPTPTSTPSQPSPTPAPIVQQTPLPRAQGHAPSASNYASAVAADSPVADWKLDETSGSQAADASGHGHTGTYAATGVTQGLAGALMADSGRSAGFDGKNGSVTAQANFANFPGSAPFSVEAWVYPTGVGGWSRVASKEDGTTNFPGWALYLNASTGQVEGSRASSTGTDSVSGNALPLNTWSYVVLTYDGAALRMYQNGVPAGSAVQSTLSMPRTNAPVMLARSYGSNNSYQGRLDEVAVYGKALSASSIARHYSASGR